MSANSKCNTTSPVGLRCCRANERLYASTETIYAALYVLPRGTLRQARKARRPRARGTDRRDHIPTMTSIAARPVEINARTVPSHWEGDRLKGSRNGSVLAPWWSERPAWSS
ncbi:MAG: hypothetical protein LZF86_110302 [Nitrospira sp.]|nr:MAG: hypothetical protein LZF86_110302 [Nitrospira sp.]